MCVLALQNLILHKYTMVILLFFFLQIGTTKLWGRHFTFMLSFSGFITYCFAGVVIHAQSTDGIHNNRQSQKISIEHIRVIKTTVGMTTGTHSKTKHRPVLGCPITFCGYCRTVEGSGLQENLACSFLTWLGLNLLPCTYEQKTILLRQSTHNDL